jgi:D-alanyl-D-alanine carboxypeptidase (penicillin-binding protein 5/6)
MLFAAAPAVQSGIDSAASELNGFGAMPSAFVYADEHTTDPAVGENTTGPAVDNNTTEPAVDNNTTKPAVDDAAPQGASAKIVKVKAPKEAKGVFAMDVVTGKILSSKNADKARPAASTSKLMTVYLVHKKIAEGDGSWEDKIKITDKKIDRMSKLSTFGGTIRLKKGRTFTIRDLYTLTLVESHNAAAIQLGRWVSGTDKKFVKLMNKTAKRLGMEKSSFVNACGLNNSDFYKYLKIPYVGKRSATNMMSPKDAAKLAKALITEYPNVMETTKRAKAKVRGKTIHTTNRIIRDKNLKKKAKDLNIVGLKTGYIKRAGGCFIGTCKMKGRDRIVTVILNDPNRFEHTVTLMKDIYAKNKLRT